MSFEFIDIELLQSPYGPSVLDKATRRYISKHCHLFLFNSNWKSDVLFITVVYYSTEHSHSHD